MPATHELLKQLEGAALSQAILESGWLFPTIETVHVLALALVIGSIAFLDLRLLGLASRDRPVTAVADQVLPWTWSGFGLAVLSGALMFASQPVKYFDNLPFRIKLGLLALAGLNMLVFQLRTWRGVAQWDRAAVLPLGARAAGALSLLFWIGVVTAGRWIAFSGY